MVSGKLAALVVALLAGGVLGAAVWQSASRWFPVTYAQEAAKAPTPDPAALAAEVERLKKVVPDQSHAMHDVDYHFTNLWFAVQQGNWPLGRFYFNETRSHLHWAVRIIPVRKDSAGNQIKLEEILQAVENGPLKQLDEAIKAESQEKFTEAYKFMLIGCYACHKASDKPYLRPRVPDHPATAIMNFDPTAAWPK